MKLSGCISLFKDSHLSLYRIGYINREGTTGTWTLASREKTTPKCMTGRLGSADAVVIVPYHSECRQLVIIREFRVAVGSFQYGFPAGLIDPGETVEQAVERELTEETGLTVVQQSATQSGGFYLFGHQRRIRGHGLCDLHGQPIGCRQQQF